MAIRSGGSICPEEEEAGVQRFEASAEIFKGVRVVAVRGELDIATSPQVRECSAMLQLTRPYRW